MGGESVFKNLDFLTGGRIKWNKSRCSPARGFSRRDKSAEERTSQPKHTWTIGKLAEAREVRWTA
ncbi:MAG: hypothetical protein Q9173_000925 [Seirophora scorigena]